ncbi:MAG TPA: polyprenol phosphomannose-dependent alpha 1,6 mannosyltransferase MptB [Jatrophihabitans sp.]|nr:polyprenol phosphomannose-dependent alpha 1,6 mannosyltransferase MptB [Jatrophihabitans sp.]
MVVSERAGTGAAPAVRWLARLDEVVQGWRLATLGWLGLAGTVLITVGSFGAGALPANDPSRTFPGIGLLRHGAAGLHTALALYYLGLVLLIVAWLVLGRLVLTGATDGHLPIGRTVVSPARLRRLLIGWMTPLLVSMPLASSDLYSYAAQAQLARHGLDPYTTTPADLPAVDLGKFLDNVAWKWVDTPSPYGPLWVAVTKWVAVGVGNHALISVLLLRLLPFAAVLALTWLLPMLAERYGRRPDLALWLAVANPLILVHAVGGGHNDAVMVALLVAGLVVASRPAANWRHLLGALALTTLAAAVKSPGLVAVAFVVPIYLSGRAGLRPRDWLRWCAVAVGITVAVFAVVSLIAGVGLGWTRQVSSGVPVINFMSLPTLLAVLYRAVLGAAHAGTLVDGTVRGFRTVGTVASGLLLIYLWLRAARGHRDRRLVLRLLALALFGIVVLGPAVQPWYFSWALTVLAVLALSPRTIFLVAAGSISLTLLTRPMGSSLEAVAYLSGVVVAVIASRALLGPVVRSRAC